MSRSIGNYITCGILAFVFILFLPVILLPLLLVLIVCTGCSVMIFRSLARLACRPGVEWYMLMLDWWLALIAAAMGRAVFLNRATIAYRQHGGNVVGAKDPRSAGYVLQKLKGGAVRRSLVDTARQAGAYLSSYRQELTPDQQALQADYAAAPEKGKLARLTLYRRRGLWKCGLNRRIGQILWW